MSTKAAAPRARRAGWRSGSLLVGLLVISLLTLTPTVAEAAPRKRATAVSGWSSSQVVVDRGDPVRFGVTVRPASRAKARRVSLQHRATGSAQWRPVATTRTDRRGRATLAWRAVSAGGQLRVVVAGTRRAKPVVTRARALQVRAAAVTATPSEFEAEVVRLTNQARGVARTCGGDRYPAVGAIRVDQRLGTAARRYAARMGREGFFSHTAPDGSGPRDRMLAEGYDSGGWGENIAAGQQTPEAVVAAWIASEGHCRNLMHPGWRDIGVGHHLEPGSRYGHYWVQKFGAGSR